MTSQDSLTSTASLHLDQTLSSGIIEGTKLGMQMTGVEHRPVGAMMFSPLPSDVAVIVGIIGKSNGTMTLNISERGMCYLASQLLCEEITEVGEDTYDAIMEVGNMVAGCIKDLLADSDFKLQYISVPSLILGSNYNVYYTRGITNVSIIFEMPDLTGIAGPERFFTVTMSLLRQVA